MTIDRKRIGRILLPLGILAAGALITVALVKRPRGADRAEVERTPPLVEVVRVSTQTVSTRVTASGTVTPARQVSLTPEVSGRVVSTSPALLPGGRIDAGAWLVRVDGRDYRVAIEQERARVAQAELELALEEGRQPIAEREWELLGGSEPADASSLALRGPQLEAARQNLQSARAGLERAELNLARTELRAPFNAIVLDEQVEVGQLVGPTAPVITLAGADRFWVKVSVPVEQLADLAIPGVNADDGSPARVLHGPSGAPLVERDGVVLRLMGELEPQTRTAQLLVAVDDPLGGGDGELPLLPGAFVQVEIEGNAVAGAVTVPRSALVDGAVVWVVDDNDQLARRPVEVGWGSSDEVVLIDGLRDGERVVTSPLSLSIDGLDVQVSERSAVADAG